MIPVGSSLSAGHGRCLFAVGFPCEVRDGRHPLNHGMARSAKKQRDELQAGILVALAALEWVRISCMGFL